MSTICAWEHDYMIMPDLETGLLQPKANVATSWSKKIVQLTRYNPRINTFSKSHWILKRNKYVKRTPQKTYNLYTTFTSVCIFSILFSIHSLRCWQGEIVSQSRASLVGDHSFSLMTLMCDSRWECKETLDASHFWGGQRVSPLTEQLLLVFVVKIPQIRRVIKKITNS